VYRVSVRPRGGATSTHWLGEQAEARARPGLPGGGRGSSNSGEGNGNAGQLVPVAALGRPREEV
jgi:hypothetical protein